MIPSGRKISAPFALTGNAIGKHEKEEEKKIFYGWYVLAVGMTGTFMSGGVSQLFMSIMLKPLTAEFGWSRTAATGAITTGTIMAGLLSLVFGKLADRYGPRLLTSLGALATAAAAMAITRFVNLWQFYVVYVIARVISTNTLASIAPQTAAVNWFRRFRGRAMGLLSMGPPLGASVLVMVAQFIMVHHGWRMFFIAYAAALVFFMALPAALVLRRRPEDLGLVPDGIQNPPSTPRDQRFSGSEVSWTLSEAIRTPTLWCLIAAIILGVLVNAGLGFHLVAYYTDVGILSSVAVGALSLTPLPGRRPMSYGDSCRSSFRNGCWRQR